MDDIEDRLKRIEERIGNLPVLWPQQTLPNVTQILKGKLLADLSSGEESEADCGLYEMDSEGKWFYPDDPEIVTVLPWEGMPETSTGIKADSPVLIQKQKQTYYALGSICQTEQEGDE